MRSNRSQESGITLLEVLIAMALLAFVSIGIFQATSRSFEVTSVLGSESTDTTAILLSLQRVEADLAQIYTPLIGPAGKPEGDKTAFWSAALRSDGYRRSRLLGSGEKVTFIANNNRRVEAGSAQSDFVKITWEVERGNDNTYTLYRSADWDAFRYEEGTAEKPVRVALLESLSSAKFTYYRKENKTWEDRWDSEDTYAKEETRFPELIKLRVEAPDPLNRASQLPWEIIVRPNMPLNYKDAKARAAERQRFTD